MAYMQKFQVLTKTRVRTAVAGSILVGAAVAAAFGYAAYQQIDIKSGASRTAKEERAPAIVDASKLKRDLQSANAKIVSLHQTWQRAKEKDRARVLKQILDIAKKRKNTMAALMPVDPQGANNLALASDFRAKLPTEAQEWLEVYKEIEGELDIFHADNFKQGQSYEQYFLRDDAKMTTLLFMADPEFDALSGDRIFATGIFFSDIGLALKDKNPKVLAASPPETLGDQRTIVALVRLSGGPGPENYPNAQSVYQEAIFGQHNASISPATAFSAAMPSLRRFIEDISSGKATMSGSVMDWISISASDPTELDSIAQKVINALDDQVDWSTIDRLLMLYSIDSDDLYDFGGNSELGKKTFYSNDGAARLSPSATVIDNSMNIIIHEFGHGLGLRHAAAWRCPQGVGPDLTVLNQDGICDTPTYGDKRDTMGEGVIGFSTAHREKLGWFEPGWSATVADRGEYTLKAKDLNGTGIKQIKVPLGDQGFYSIEFDTGFLPIFYEEFAEYKYGGNIFVRLVSPKSRSGRDTFQLQYISEDDSTNIQEVVVDVKKPFHDLYRNIHIGVNEALGTERQVVVLNNVIFPQFDLSALTVNSELTADGEIITQATISGPAYWIDLGNLHFQYLDEGSNILAECRRAIGVFETPTAGDIITIDRTITTPRPLCDLSNSQRAKVSAVRVWVDIDQLFPETNEFNNMAQAPVPKPDLVITDLQIALTATDYVFTVIIQNNGNAPTVNLSGERTYQIRLRKFKEDGTDSSLLWREYTDTIMPGASAQVVITEPRADYEASLQEAVAIIAEVETRIESNTMNNTFYKEMPKPDLQVSNLTISQSQDGSWIQTARVVNQGGVSIALPFEVEFRRIMSSSAYVVDGIVSVTTLLEAGAFVDVQGPTLTAAQVEEAAWLRAWADSGNVILESSENNNTKKIPAP